uniref:Uncharacterized protein n=1 Tax=Salmo trutta TaxID=8032 RepID=A0A673Y9K3_SALTR
MFNWLLNCGLKMPVLSDTECKGYKKIETVTKQIISLLKRNKVHSDVIFKYVAKERVVMPDNKEKHQLVKWTLEFWSTGEEQIHLFTWGTKSGLKALSSPHGLALVAVAGTIHRDRECVGIYEQAFGLLRSPLDQNKWKIKFMVLKVKGQEALRVGENLLSPILTWDSNDLQLLCR